MLGFIGSMAVPFMICFIIGYGFFKRIDVYKSFCHGVLKGFDTLKTIFPPLFALFTAVSVFRASGLVDFLSRLLEPVCRFLHFPSELVPFVLLRPVSGSGSLAMATDIFQSLGADSFEGRLASVIMASTETSLYTTAVYFGAVGVKNIRHSLICALCADAFSVVISAIVCTLWQ